MLRDKNLVPLSHQHQHALGLCVRIGRAIQQQGADLKFWQDEIVRQFQEEISFHFAAEEKVLFPAAARIPSLSMLVDQLLIEHGVLRKAVQQAQAHQMNSADLQMFAAGLSDHVRKEEQQLFEEMQRSLSSQDLARLGAELDQFFATSGMSETNSAVRIPGQNGTA